MPSASAVPLRVVLVEPALEDNGAVRVSLDRADRWVGAGASVVVFVVEHRGGDLVAVPAGLEVRFATAVPRRFRWTFLLGLFRLWRLARSADVVVSGREIQVGLVLSWLTARLARRPLAVTVQSRPDIALEEYVGDRWKAPVRRSLVGADLAVCVAAGLVPVLADLGLPAGRARAVTNGVDLEAVRRAAGRDPALALPPGPYVAASGRLHRQKGFDVLLRAHAGALAIGAPPHTVVLLGDGPDRSSLEALADDLGVADTVVFAGFVANPHAVVARAEAFVLPSRWEGYPLALVEALVCGTPAIAADCVSGPREVLDGERFGRLVPVDDVDALAAALTDHLRDPAPLRARARAGSGAADVRFDPARAATHHLALLEDLAGGRRPLTSGRGEEPGKRPGT